MEQLQQEALLQLLALLAFSVSKAQDSSQPHHVHSVHTEQQLATQGSLNVRVAKPHSTAPNKEWQMLQPTTKITFALMVTSAMRDPTLLQVAVNVLLIIIAMQVFQLCVPRVNTLKTQDLLRQLSAWIVLPENIVPLILKAS